MMELLHDTGVRLGLVTNGDHWMLVDAPKGETTGFASWYATLWLEEPITLRAFRTLLGGHRFFGVPEDETLEATARPRAPRTSRKSPTSLAIRSARRSRCSSSRSTRRPGQRRDLLEGVPEAELYEAALTVMMRLVFLFCAEERDLLLLGDELYDKNYAVSTLREQLQEHGRPARRGSAGAPARCVEPAADDLPGGLRRASSTTGSSSPPTAGKLFDPDRFPFLEGRTLGDELEGHPRPRRCRSTTARCCTCSKPSRCSRSSCQAADRPRPQLSFRALDIEQIGHVYEGLLDHTARRATEPVLGLSGPRDDEPEVALSEAGGPGGEGRGRPAEVLKDETGRSSSRHR